MVNQKKEFLKNLAKFREIEAEFDKKQEKKKINYILPIIQALSFADFAIKLAGNPNAEIDKIRSKFAEFYYFSYGQDIKKMNKSDFSPELALKIEEFQKNPENFDKQSLIDEIVKYEEKYTHAHSRILFNYGEISDQIFQSLDEDSKNKIKDKANQIGLAKNSPEFLNIIFEIHEMLGIEKNSSVIDKDDLENHALLNQMTNYSQNILQVLGAFVDEDSFWEMVEKLQNKSSKSDDLSRFLTPNKLNYGKGFELMEEKQVDVTVGIETEFLLSCDKADQNDVVKRVLSDLNSRRFMQKKYGLKETVPAIEDMSIFEAKREEIANKGLILDIDAVKRDLGKRINDNNWQEINDLINKEFEKKEQLLKYIEKRCNNFTPEEAYFYDLFFLDSVAKEFKVEIEDIFSPQDSDEENFKKAIKWIAKGRFYEKLLDMIRAHEISFGPFALNEVVDKKKELISYMRLKANKHGLLMNDANVQINLAINLDGKNILIPKIEDKNGEKVVKTNDLARKILLVIEKSLAKMAKKEGVLRNQNEIQAGFDRKKTIDEELKGTPYFEVDSDLGAFLNHKKLAAKNVTLRISKINDQVAVVEVRLIGNNTHFKAFDNEQRTFSSGIEYVMEAVLPFLTKEIGEFLSTNSKEHLKSMMTKDVLVNFDGSIEGLEGVKVGKIIRAGLYEDHEKKHDSLSELKKSLSPAKKVQKPEVSGLSKDDSGVVYK
jgi:hypothetical protein